MMDASTQTLKDELDQALADLDEAATLSEINQTLVDMLDAMKARKAPVINVEVSPTPVTVQVNPTPITIEAPPVAAFDIQVEDVKYDDKNRFISARMTRVPAKAAK